MLSPGTILLRSSLSFIQFFFLNSCMIYEHQQCSTNSRGIFVNTNEKIWVYVLDVRYIQLPTCIYITHIAWMLSATNNISYEIRFLSQFNGSAICFVHVMWMFVCLLEYVFVCARQSLLFSPIPMYIHWMFRGFLSYRKSTILILYKT